MHYLGSTKTLLVDLPQNQYRQTIFVILLLPSDALTFRSNGSSI